MWLKSFEGDIRNLMPGLSRIENSVSVIRPILNEMSESEYGDKSLITNEFEIVVNRFNGAS